jgi:probable phosphoglycerate mutase
MSASGPIYLLRHGETIWNRAQRLQGRKNTPLTLRGVRQAEAMGHALARTLNGAPPAIFLASPLGRTRQTAAIVADAIGFDPEAMVYLDRLQETTFGIWDGLNMEEILADHGDAWRQRNQNKWLNPPPEGESYAMVAERVGGFLDELPAARPMVIVAHGSLNRVLRGLWRGLDPAAYMQLDEPQDGFYRLEAGGAETFVQA